MSSAHPAPPRRASRALHVGPVQVGGGAPVSVQTMCTTDTADVRATLDQIRAVADLGCDIVRVAVPHRRCIAPLRQVCAASPLPVVADIHFDHRLAVAASDSGVAGLRFNPGTIGDPTAVEELARAAADHGLSIRVGANAGSLDQRALSAHGGDVAAALVDSALGHAALLEGAGFGAIKLSLKAADPLVTIAANRACARRCDYPLHLGLTEAGPLLAGAVRSSAALAVLLAEGIGDTIRVSLSAAPEHEVWAARQLLAGLGLRCDAVHVVSCPGCGRATVEVQQVAGRVEQRLRQLRVPLRIAVMGCEVNGPGEARAADAGIAGGAGSWTLYRAGAVVRRLGSSHEAEAALLVEVERLAADRD